MDFCCDILYSVFSNQNSESMNTKGFMADVVGKHNELIHMLAEQYTSITVKELKR